MACLYSTISDIVSSNVPQIQEAAVFSLFAQLVLFCFWATLLQPAASSCAHSACGIFAFATFGVGVERVVLVAVCVAENFCLPFFVFTFLQAGLKSFSNKRSLQNVRRFVIANLLLACRIVQVGVRFFVFE